MSFPERVAAHAADIRPVRVALAILSAPFYLLGLLVGLVWVAVAWAAAAVVVGVHDMRDRSTARSDEVTDGAG